MTTCENYGVYSHQQIHHEMYDGAGPSSQSDAVQGWKELADRLNTIRHYLDSAISGVQASRHGVAADAAAGSMAPLGRWLDEAQRLAHDTRERIDHQITGFTTARNNIPEVPPQPRGWGWQEIPVIDIFTTSDQEADEAFNAEQQRQARAAMTEYQNGTNERVESLPHFAPPPTGAPELTVPAGIRPGVGVLPGDVGRVLGPGAVAGPDAVTHAALPAGVQGDTPGGLTGTPAVVTGPQGGAGTGGLDGRPAPLAPASSLGGGHEGVAPSTTPIGGPHAAGSARRGTDRGGAGGGRGGSSPGRSGPGGRRTRDIGGFGPERAAGARGSAPTQVPGLTRVGRAGDPRADAASAPLGGPVGSRAGHDDERQRPSYLIESDPNRLIGELPPTAPAVLGDDPPNGEDPPDDEDPTNDDPS